MRAHRGRPRDEEKNVAILEAASKLFLEKGYSSTSMDEVAKRACVSKQTVYSHFEGKEALFTAAVRARIDEHSPEGALRQVHEHTLEADFYAVCDSFVRLLISEEAINIFRLLASDAPKDNALAQAFWEAGPERMLVSLEKFLVERVERGELMISDVPAAAVQLVSLLKGGHHFRLSIGLEDAMDATEIKTHVQQVVDMFLSAYRARARA